MRAYHGDPGMIGLEPTFDEHLENIVAVFREVRRVLRKGGTLWLNYGDAYAATTKGQGGEGDGRQGRNGGSRLTDRRSNLSGFKPKDLMLMPARVAMALQADGWWLRSEIVWHKPNPMPESVTDRPTSAHEKLFLLSRESRYFYDAEAVRTRWAASTEERLQHAWTRAPRRGVPPDAETDSGAGHGPGANLRNVWTIPTHGYSEAHFATFPPALVEPCIKAGTSEKGACAECGAPWVRETRVDDPNGRHGTQGQTIEGDSTGMAKRGVPPSQGRPTITTTGWSPSCECDAGVRPCVVLDPFGGSGTVGLVADRLQRDAVLIEISPDYAEMARRRIYDDAPLLATP